MTKKQSEQAEAIASLLETLKPGDTVYTQLKHVSRSGMQRVIQLVLLTHDKDKGQCEPRWIGYVAALAMQDRYDRDREGIVIGGCGQDMGYALVHNLGYRLWPNGYDCIGADKCPSNDHSNAYYTERDGRCVICDKSLGASKYVRKASEHRQYRVCSAACVSAPWHHSSGGYALNHRWL